MRVKPVCPVFGTCGGCQLQHASYTLQLEIKAGIVRDALKRLGGFELPEIQCTASPKQWGYRNKASFPVRAIRGKPVAGFYETNSHRLVPLTTCPVNAASLNGLFGLLQKELPGLALNVYDERQHKGTLRHLILRTGIRTQQNLLSLVVNGSLNARNMKSIAGLCRSLKELTVLTLNHNSRPGNVILGSRTESIKGSLIAERLDNWTLSYDTTSFFQVNTEQAEQIYRYVGEQVLGANILELYSGVGSLTCYLAGSGVSYNRRVTAVEEWPHAVDLMRDNLTNNGIGNVHVAGGDAGEVLANLPGDYDTIVLDPPRSGCERVVLDKILEYKPQRVVYVSCNPATLARDCKILGQEGYRIKTVRSFDMFPQTVHVETVLIMER